MRSPRRISHCLLILALAGCSSTGYQREKGRWAWVWYDGSGRQVRYLPEAGRDLKVFANADYATSAGQVYLWGVRLPEADPARFQLLTYPYSRDSARVYCGSVPITGADPDNFQVLGGLLNLNAVSPASAYEIIVGPINAVPGDAEIVVTQGWSRDEKTCFFGPTPLAGADPASFVILNDWYAQDVNQVYCGHRAIPGADLATFHTTGPLIAADKNNQYTKWQFDGK